MGVYNFMKHWFKQPESTPPLALDGSKTRNDSIFRYPVRQVARGIRYKPLAELIGREVTVRSVESADSDFLAVVGNHVDRDHARRPLIRIGTGTHTRYGFLDLAFRCQRELLAKEVQSGLAVLTSLGFILHLDSGPFVVADDLEQMVKDIAKQEAYLLLILVDESFQNVEPLSRTNPPSHEREHYTPKFPIRFRVADACVANSTLVWRWKHFYW